MKKAGPKAGGVSRKRFIRVGESMTTEQRKMMDQVEADLREGKIEPVDDWHEFRPDRWRAEWEGDRDFIIEVIYDAETRTAVVFAYSYYRSKTLRIQ